MFWAVARSAACAHEGAEQAEVTALLGVPLHAEHESGEAVELGRPGLDRLDRAVLFPGHRLEPVAEQVDRLVVLGRHLEDLVPGQDRGQRAVRADPHVVQAEPARRAVVPLVPVQVGNVLVQRAAPADVQDLHAAADGKQRHPLPQRVAGDGEVPGVPRRHGNLRLRVPRRAVPHRLDVRTARDHQAVQARYRGAGLVVVAARRQQDRPSAAAPHRVHVHIGKDRGPGRPATPGRLILVCGYANNRRHSSPLNCSSVAPLPQRTQENHDHDHSERTVVCSPSATAHLPCPRIACADGMTGGGVVIQVSSVASGVPEDNVSNNLCLQDNHCISVIAGSRGEQGNW